jgi:two-component system nitrogen regulation response regulator GlnG
MQELYRAVARLAGTELTVLIEGESGSGKSLVALVLHDFGKRRDGRFVAVNLGSAPRDQVDTELFGSGEGVLGKVVEADGGTLFLDEISDMSLDAQIRLLRVFDGAEPARNPRTGRRPEVRVIAATSRDLRGLIAQGLFREDLYFRLNVAPLRLPPLRARAEDIAELARAFLLRAAREGLPAKAIDERALDRLRLHPWPGNVRELENLMRRVCALYADETITDAIVERELAARPAGQAGEAPETLCVLVERHLASEFARHADRLPPHGLYDRVLAEVERPLFQLTLAATRGNQVRAAEVLGLNRNTLRKRLTDLGLEAKAPR